MLNRINNFKKNNIFLHYFRNTSWMMLEQLLRMVAGLFIGVWVARYLGPESFGLLSYVLAFFAIFMGITKLGLDGVVVRELVNKPDECKIYIGTAFWLKVASAVLMIALIFIITPLASSDNQTNKYLMIVGLGLFFQSFEVIEFYFQSKVMLKMVSISKIFQLLLSSIVKIFLVLNEASLDYFIMLVTFDMFSLALSTYMIYKVKGEPFFYNTFDFQLAKELLMSSWPLILSAFSISLAMRIDQIMISEFIGNYYVGIYSAGVRIAEVFGVLAIVTSTSLYPMIINRVSNNQMNDIKRLIRIGFYILIISSVIIILFSKLIILMLFGDEYTEASLVLSILVFSIPFTYINLITSKVLISENKTKDVMYRQYILLGMNVFLNLFLIPKYGVVGAALATLLSDVIVSVFVDLIFPKNRGLGILKIKSLIGV